jgi:DNA-binding transcriptional regulator YhcF (GntR family)
VHVQLDNSRPIWAQLVDEFRRNIAAAVWQPGQKLPPVRELALELGVNPNTVQKSLSEVDRLGLTTTERTSGRFVTRDAALIASTRASLALTTADGFASVARGLGMSLEEAVGLLHDRWQLGKDSS